MGDATVDSVLKKYGTSGISAILRTLHEEVVEVTFNVHRQSATSEMADDLESAFRAYKNQIAHEREMEG